MLRGSIEAAEALAEEQAGVVRLAGAEIPVPRFGPQPPTRDSTGAIAAMPFYAGQSVGAVRAVQPAAEIVAELATGCRAAPRSSYAFRERIESSAPESSSRADAPLERHPTMPSGRTRHAPSGEMP